MNFWNIENFNNSTDLVADFSSSLTDISNTCIPNTYLNVDICVEKNFLSSMPADSLLSRYPAFKITFSPHFLELYKHKPNAVKHFGLRISPLLESSNINPNNIEKHFITDIPSWCIRKPNSYFI